LDKQQAAFEKRPEVAADEFRTNFSFISLCLFAQLLNPLSTPPRRVEGLRKVLRLSHHFDILKLHYADGVKRATLVGNRVFRNPQLPRSKKPPDVEACRIARVMAAEILQISFAVYPFTGLRVIADDLLVVDLMLDILVSGRRSGPVLPQNGFDLPGFHALLVLVFHLCHFGVLCLENTGSSFAGVVPSKTIGKR
jgi:hypothetical protein